MSHFKDISEFVETDFDFMKTLTLMERGIGNLITFSTLRKLKLAKRKDEVRREKRGREEEDGIIRGGGG